MADRYYYLGPWQWQSGETPGWYPPPGTIGLLDLRPRGNVAAYGFFATEAPLNDSAYTEFGDGLDLREHYMTQTDRDAWFDALGVTIPSLWTLLDALVTTLGNQADPLGLERSRPLLATHLGNLEIYLGGHGLIWQRKFQGEADPTWAKVQKVLQEDYRGIEAIASLTDGDAHQRILSIWARKYGIPDTDKFIPDDMEKVKSLPPATTINDTFNRGDADALGTSSDGDWSWAEPTGDIDIVSNKAVCQGGDGSGRAEKDLSSDDIHVLADISGTLISAGVCGRFNPAATNTYYTGRYSDSQTDMQLYKRVAGSFSLLDDLLETPSSPYELKLTCDGSTIKVYVDSVEKLTATDGGITGYLRNGIRGNHGFDIWDDFQAADLVAAGNPWYQYLQQAG